MPELMAALGTSVERTVFRKLAVLRYRASYTHRGRYYVLDETARFDSLGLWSFRSVWFSAHGTLVETVTALVDASRTGYFVAELDELLHVRTKDCLRHLAQRGRLAREDVSGRQLACSADPARRRVQLAARQSLLGAAGVAAAEPVTDELKATIILFLGLLDEKQRRLFAGLESLKLGRGGDALVAQTLGLDPETVAKGRHALLHHEIDPVRVRRPEGGGKKTPVILSHIREILKHETAGDPMTGLKWTRKTTAKVASELGRAGIPASPNTVARLLKDLDFRLRSNEKKIARCLPADRDAQFRTIEALRKSFVADGLPIISIDTKKKEQIGCFKNPGREWSVEPRPVLDHDFRSDSKGLAIPYGIYLPIPNIGMVFVGTSHDTPEFAVDCVEAWWRLDGHARFQDADRLLILADGGGSNGARCRAWKYFLQHRLCNVHRITVTVAHYPSGASKWNPIEHRLFSEISKNWAGIPLESYETVLNYIRTTATSTGLRVLSALIDREYNTGVKITDKELAGLSLKYAPTLPLWNYSIHPE